MLSILVIAAYLAFWPVPIEAVNWKAPAAPGYQGAHAVNSKLTGQRHISLGAEQGPEHVVLGADGLLYTAVASGHILRMDRDGGAQAVLASTGGRPLGLDFDAHGALIVADAIKGLLSVAPDGKVTLLADTVDGKAIGFANAVAVASDGKIYFTDASERFTAARRGGTVEAAMLDVMEQSATGRVLEYDPAAMATRVVATGLSFANGVVLSADQRHLFVAESGRYRVWKIAVGAARLDIARPSPQARILADNLPGYPDNLTRGLDGRIWLGLAGQRNDLDAMAERPYLRELALRIPRFMWSMPRPYGHVVALSEDGKVLDDLQDPSGASPLTTGVTETADRLYIQNANGGSLGWLAK